MWSNIYMVSENRGSYVSFHVLLTILHKLGKRDKMRGLPSIFFLHFRTQINKFKKWSMYVRFYLSYDIKINLKSYFWPESVKILPLKIL